MSTIYLKYDNNIYQYKGSENDFKKLIISALNNKNDTAIQQKLSIYKRCELLDALFNNYVAKNIILNENGKLKQILFFEGINIIEFDKLNFTFIDFNDELYKMSNSNDKNYIIDQSRNLIDLIKKSKLISVKLGSLITISDILNILEEINEDIELEKIKVKFDEINKLISHPKEVFDIAFDLKNDLKCDDKNK